MTAYIVRKGAQKKLGILKKREETLRHHIRNGFSEAKLTQVAEEVRSSQLAVIKCLQHENEIVRSEDEERLRNLHEKLQSRAEHWLELSVLDIVTIYRHAVDEHQDPLPKTVEAPDPHPTKSPIEPKSGENRRL